MSGEWRFNYRPTANLLKVTSSAHLCWEQNDEWAVTRRYMTLETVAAICEDTTMDPAKIAAL